MADFSQLKQFDVSSDATASYSMGQIATGDFIPTLTVKPASDANKLYFNAALKGSAKNRRALKGQITSALLDETRGEDIERYARFVVVGWKDVYDADGDAVPFDQQNVRDFLNAIPAWVFDDLRAFCAEPTNFVDLVDAEDTAGN